MNSPAIIATAATAATAVLVVCLGGTALITAATLDCAETGASAGPSSTPPSPPPGAAATNVTIAHTRSPEADSGCVIGEWTQSVHAPIVSGFRTPERPDHDGVDLGAARYTPIRAASTGTVIVARCDHATGNCDHDGSPSTPGCGWFVDIQHPAGIITRYCHLVTQPAVTVGQPVAVGQLIGLVGTSGHSSGPHLHFEVHLHTDRSPAGAIDPVPFMAARQAPLGQA
jgi:murein DD-endopeptidase MepM/ murein hydrolase activator NlpD